MGPESPLDERLCQTYEVLPNLCPSFPKVIWSCWIMPISWVWPNYAKVFQLYQLMPKSSSYINLCQTCEILFDLWQSYWVISNYAHLWKFAKVMPNFSSCVEVFVKLFSSFLLCQTYQNFVEVMPNLSNYVELCQFTKFCTNYAINSEVYRNFAKVIQLYRIIPKLWNLAQIMPKSSIYDELCPFMKFCQNYDNFWIFLPSYAKVVMFCKSYTKVMKFC